MSLKWKYVIHLEETFIYFIVRAVPEDQANHKPRAKEFLYFQLETGVIEVKFKLDISNLHGRTHLNFRLFSNIWDT